MTEMKFSSVFNDLTIDVSCLIACSVCVCVCVLALMYAEKGVATCFLRWMMMSEGLDRVSFWFVLRAGNDPLKAEVNIMKLTDSWQFLLRVFLSDSELQQRRTLTAGTPPWVGHLLQFEGSSGKLSIRLQTGSKKTICYQDNRSLFPQQRCVQLIDPISHNAMHRGNDRATHKTTTRVIPKLVTVLNK